MRQHRARLTPDLTGLADTIGRWWMCTRHGHHWTDRADPTACIDCGRIRKETR